jgi:hypothetical protein
VNAEEVSTVAIALWDGLVQAQIDRFLECDLATTLGHAYGALWQGVRENGENEGNNRMVE